MKIALTVLSSVLLWTGCSVLPGPQTGDDREVILLDVRTPDEYRQKHIPGSILLPHDQIEQRASAVLPDKQADIRLFCRSGRRSNLAKLKLESLGYTNIRDLGAIENAARVLERDITRQE